MGIGPQRLGTAKGFTPCGSPMKQRSGEIEVTPKPIQRGSYSDELQQGALVTTVGASDVKGNKVKRRRMSLVETPSGISKTKASSSSSNPRGSKKRKHMRVNPDGTGTVVVGNRVRQINNPNKAARKLGRIKNRFNKQISRFAEKITTGNSPI